MLRGRFRSSALSANDTTRSSRAAWGRPILLIIVRPVGTIRRHERVDRFARDDRRRGHEPTSGVPAELAPLAGRRVRAAARPDVDRLPRPLRGWCAVLAPRPVGEGDRAGRDDRPDQRLLGLPRTRADLHRLLLRARDRGILRGVPADPHALRGRGRSPAPVPDDDPGSSGAGHHSRCGGAHGRGHSRPSPAPTSRASRSRSSPASSSSRPSTRPSCSSCSTGSSGR